MGEANRDVPPKGLTKEGLAEWWREKLSGIRFEAKEGWPRECPKCKDLNPCSGIFTCGSCGTSLRFAKRVRENNQFDSP